MQETMLQYVIRKLKENRGRIPDISQQTNLKLSTVQSIMYEKTDNPGVNTVQTLHDYFKKSAD